MDAHEESGLPLMAEKKVTSWTTTVTLCAGALLASGAFLRSGGGPAAAAATSAAATSGLAGRAPTALVSTFTAAKKATACMAHDDVSIYKYTIASSMAVADGEWADSFLGCQFRDVTDAHGCADLGKTSCLASTLAYNLHFVVNHVTPDSAAVADWDATMLAAHGDLSTFNAFMDYRLVFYAPNLDTLTQTLLEAGTPFMMRQTPGTVSADSTDSTDVAPADTWYSLVVASPSGKIFEVTSTQFNKKQLSASAAGKTWLEQQGGDVKEWTADPHACPHAQLAATSHGYSAAELDAFHATYADGDNTKLLPIRNQIAVADLPEATAWWAAYLPSVKVQHLNGNTASCSAASFHLSSYMASEFKVETRLVQNDHARGAADVKAFVSYIQGVHALNTAPNRGWDAWYDRHLGLLFNTCPLDDYMSKFNQGGVSFNPHGRALTNDQGATTQHVWTEGVQGYGVEMQGFYDFSFRDCYTIFDWCTETTNGKEFCSADMDPTETAATSA